MATGRVLRNVGTAEERVAAMLSGHGAALRRVARRFSVCADDAEDALQRALEIYVRRLETVDRATEVAWLKVVVRNEALAVRRTRQESVAAPEIDVEAAVEADDRPLDERVASRERSARSAESLSRLKHDEALALLLKAEGHSYREIAARQGWTYTKVNRAITEGRARFMRNYRAIEEGEACDALAPVLAALADGRATADQLRLARPHLRHCARCRATLRDLHAPWHRRVAAWLPLPAVIVSPLRDRLTAPAPDATEPGTLRPLDTVPDLAGVVDRVTAPRIRIPSPKAELQQLLHRVTGSDVATGVHLATSGSGGRTAAVAALIGFCLSGVGAGTYCVATALLRDPPVVRSVEKAGIKRREPTHRERARSTRTATPSRAAQPFRPAAAATPAPTTRKPRPTRARRPAPHPPPRPGPSRSSASRVRPEPRVARPGRPGPPSRQAPRPRRRGAGTVRAEEEAVEVRRRRAEGSSCREVAQGMRRHGARAGRSQGTTARASGSWPRTARPPSTGTIAPLT